MGNGSEGGAALAGHTLAQHGGGFVGAGGQLGGALEGGHGHLVGLGFAQTHVLTGTGHGFQEEEHIGRAGAGQCGHGVQVAFLLHPHELAGGADHGFHLRAAGGIHIGAGEQAGHALAHQGGRVGHGTHDAAGAQPLGDAVGGDAGCHAQVQGMAGVGDGGSGRVLEGLGLDGPDHQFCGLQRSGCGRQRVDTEFGFQRIAGCLERLDHGDAGSGQALGKQAADEGTGHVAAADEGDGRGMGCGGCHERLRKARGSAPTKGLP